MGIRTATFRKAYEEYLAEKKSMGRQEETLKLYRIHIKHFIESDNLWDINTMILNKDVYHWWIEEMQEDENKQDVTVASYCRSVRAFIYWLQENDYCDYFKIEIPSFKKKVKRTYTDEELATLLQKPEKHCSETKYITWVYINLCISTGLRLSSLLNIKVKDYVKDEKSIYVDTMKNNTPRIIYLNDEVTQILNKYISYFGLEDDDWMFCTAEGGRLAKRTIQQMVHDYNLDYNVEKTSIHLFRHTFAKNYYKETKDIYSLCRILNHSTISTTEMYLRDLGIDSVSATSYNPQKQYVNTTQKRRGKMK